MPSSSYVPGTNNYREPDTLPSYDNNTTYLNIIKGILTGEENANKYANITSFKTTMQEDYNAMIKSIEKYHGFYVSRYEMSKSTSNTVQSKKNSTPLTAVTQGANTWYGLYAYGKTYTNSINSIVSSMIWGSQYDAMMRWMQNGENKIDVTGNIGGNRNTGTKTGTVETDIIKNIYDLYGCYYEWTLEETNYNNTRYSRTDRGRWLHKYPFT